MPKRKHPTPTAIKKALSGCVVDANVPGPMAVVAEQGPDFWLPRSIECLRTAETDGSDYFAEVRKAVSLLGMLLADHERACVRSETVRMRAFQELDGVYDG